MAGPLGRQCAAPRYACRYVASSAYQYVARSAYQYVHRVVHARMAARGRVEIVVEIAVAASRYARAFRRRPAANGGAAVSGGLADTQKSDRRSRLRMTRRSRLQSADSLGHRGVCRWHGAAPDRARAAISAGFASHNPLCDRSQFSASIRDRTEIHNCDPAGVCDWNTSAYCSDQMRSKTLHLEVCTSTQ
jgi:hypothetical protein